MRQAYSILNKDIYNFDKTGFIIGTGLSFKVVISVDTVGRAIYI